MSSPLSRLRRDRHKPKSADIAESTKAPLVVEIDQEIHESAAEDNGGVGSPPSSPQPTDDNGDFLTPVKNSRNNADDTHVTYDATPDKEESVSEHDDDDDSLLNLVSSDDDGSDVLSVISDAVGLSSAIDWVDGVVNSSIPTSAESTTSEPPSLSGKKTSKQAGTAPNSDLAELAEEEANDETSLHSRPMDERTSAFISRDMRDINTSQSDIGTSNSTTERSYSSRYAPTSAASSPATKYTTDQDTYYTGNDTSHDYTNTEGDTTVDDKGSPSSSGHGDGHESTRTHSAYSAASSMSYTNNTDQETYQSSDGDHLHYSSRSSSRDHHHHHHHRFHQDEHQRNQLEAYDDEADDEGTHDCADHLENGVQDCSFCSVEDTTIATDEQHEEVNTENSSHKTKSTEASEQEESWTSAAAAAGMNAINLFSGPSDTTPENNYNNAVEDDPSAMAATAVNSVTSSLKSLFGQQTDTTIPEEKKEDEDMEDDQSTMSYPPSIKAAPSDEFSVGTHLSSRKKAAVGVLATMEEEDEIDDVDNIMNGNVNKDRAALEEGDNNLGEIIQRTENGIVRVQMAAKAPPASLDDDDKSEEGGLDSLLAAVSPAQICEDLKQMAGKSEKKSSRTGSSSSSSSSSSSETNIVADCCNDLHNPFLSNSPGAPYDLTHREPSDMEPSLELSFQAFAQQAPPVQRFSPEQVEEMAGKSEVTSDHVKNGTLLKVSTELFPTENASKDAYDNYVNGTSLMDSSIGDSSVYTDGNSIDQDKSALNASGVSSLVHIDEESAVGEQSAARGGGGGGDDGLQFGAANDMAVSAASGGPPEKKKQLSDENERRRERRFWIIIAMIALLIFTVGFVGVFVGTKDKNSGGSGTASSINNNGENKGTVTNPPSAAPVNRPVHTPNAPYFPTPTLSPTTVTTKLPISDSTASPTTERSPIAEGTVSPTRGSTTFVPTAERFTLQPVAANSEAPSVSTTSAPTISSTDSPTDPTITYVPGQLEVEENGLLLSAGLSARIIARSEEAVPIGDDGVSDDTFHVFPDAAACFTHPQGIENGWAYVSNSDENDDGGGVGALYFDGQGQVTGYQRLLEGTNYNSGGGVSPWGTWISAEESLDGEGFWDVEPYGLREPLLTALGNNVPLYYDSFTFDARNENAPKFFFSEDARSGPVRRFTPNPDLVVPLTDPNAYEMIQTGYDHEYLVLEPTGDGDTGNFRWSQIRAEGEDSSLTYHRNVEGMECQDGLLTFVTKRSREMFTLDLDSLTYSKINPVGGSFEGEPDSVTHMYKTGENPGNNILFITEEADAADGFFSGVHGYEQSTGTIYPVLKATGYSERDEVTGVTLSPDLYHMYVAIQDEGVVLDVFRTDGYPFSGPPDPTVSPTGGPTVSPTGGPTESLTGEPTASPTGEPTVSPTAGPTVSTTNEPTSAPMAERFTLQPVVTNTEAPSVSTTSAPTVSSTDSPTDPRSSRYLPGQLEVEENGLLLSAGLSARIIARSEEAVTIGGDGVSDDTFHVFPDAAACFAHPQGIENGWAYVSNSNANDGGGGVGALYFDGQGQVTGYRRLLEGTNYNSGGGVSPWGTWISAEESLDGEGFWDVEPYGLREPLLTALGSKTPLYYDSFTFDARNEFDPKFFFSEDTTWGAVRRFTPNPIVVVPPTDPNAYQMLQYNYDHEYLVLEPTGDGDTGNFRWSQSLTEGEQSASTYYQNVEGMECQDGLLTFVTKSTREMFTLDLDSLTYSKVNPVGGNFEGEPDSVTHMYKTGENPGNNILFITEEADAADGFFSGVHGYEQSTGIIYPLLKATGYSELDEVTGVTLSPDLYHMYVAIQDEGVVLDVFRTDGNPFNAPTDGIESTN